MKVISLSASTAFIAMSLVACGSPKQPAVAGAPQTETQAAAPKTIEADPADDAAIQAEYAQMPESVILRIRKDSLGNEVPGSAEMVSLNAAVKEDKIESSFLAGTALSESKNADGLDGDSSAQSYYGGWNNYDQADYNNQTTINYSNINYGNQYGSANYAGSAGNGAYGSGYGSGYGDNYGVNQNSNGWNSYGSPYYQSYRPLYGSNVYQGSYWQYNRPSCYNYGNYNYYWYSRPRCNGWSSCR